MKISKFILLRKSTLYGTDLSLLIPYIFSFKTDKLCLSVNVLIESFIWRYFFFYGNTYNVPINQFFFFLLSRKKSYKIEHNYNCGFTYYITAVDVLKTTLIRFLKKLSKTNKIFFICDKKTDDLFNLKRLNFLFWPQKWYPVLTKLGALEFYYNDWERSNFYIIESYLRAADLIVFCAYDYTRLNQTLFYKTGRATAGVCSSHMRPDVFDYPILVTVDYAYTITWVTALVLLNHTLF